MMLLCIPPRANACRIRALKLAAYYQTTRRNTTNSEQAEKLKVLFMGRDEFSCLVLEELYKARGMFAIISEDTTIHSLGYARLKEDTEAEPCCN